MFPNDYHYESPNYSIDDIVGIIVAEMKRVYKRNYEPMRPVKSEYYNYIDGEKHFQFVCPTCYGNGIHRYNGQNRQISHCPACGQLFTWEGETAK